MGILDPTNAAQKIVTPDASMFPQLEHLNATAAGRITLYGLASLLASGTSLGGTVPTPTPPSPPSSSSGTSISFADSAGAPASNQVLTALPGSNLSGYALDGSGNAVLPSASFQVGTFNGVGVVTDGLLNVTLAASTPKHELCLVFRANSGGCCQVVVKWPAMDRGRRLLSPIRHGPRKARESHDFECSLPRRPVGSGPPARLLGRSRNAAQASLTDLARLLEDSRTPHG